MAEHKKIASGKHNGAHGAEGNDPKLGEPRIAIISQKQKAVLMGKHRLEWTQTTKLADYKDVAVSVYGRNWFYSTVIEAKPSEPVPRADAERALENDQTDIGRALLFVIRRIPVELTERFDARGDPTHLRIHKIDIYSGPIVSLSGSLVEGVVFSVEIRSPRNSGMLMYRLLYEPKTPVDREKSWQQLNIGRPDHILRGLEPDFAGGSW